MSNLRKHRFRRRPVPRRRRRRAFAHRAPWPGAAAATAAVTAAVTGVTMAAATGAATAAVGAIMAAGAIAGVTGRVSSTAAAASSSATSMVGAKSSSAASAIEGRLLPCFTRWKGARRMGRRDRTRETNGPIQRQSRAVTPTLSPHAAEREVDIRGVLQGRLYDRNSRSSARKTRRILHAGEMGGVQPRQPRAGERRQVLAHGGRRRAVGFADDHQNLLVRRPGRVSRKSASRSAAQQPRIAAGVAAVEQVRNLRRDLGMRLAERRRSASAAGSPA